MEEKGGEVLSKQQNPSIYLHFWKGRFMEKKKRLEVALNEHLHHRGWGKRWTVLINNF